MDFSVLYLLLMLNLPIHLNGTHYKTLVSKGNSLLAARLGDLERDRWSDWKTLDSR